MLLPSARTVSEQLIIRSKQLEVNVLWVVLGGFELSINDRLYYEAVDPAGKVISGYGDLPAMPLAISCMRLYPTLT